MFEKEKEIYDELIDIQLLDGGDHLKYSKNVEDIYEITKSSFAFGVVFNRLKSCEKKYEIYLYIMNHNSIITRIMYNTDFQTFADANEYFNNIKKLIDEKSALDILNICRKIMKK